MKIISLKVIALPNTEYSSLCIEELSCRKCDLSLDACKSYSQGQSFHSFHRAKLETENFLDNQKYKFGAVSEQVRFNGRLCQILN